MPCPIAKRNEECLLLNCLFSHDIAVDSRTSDPAVVSPLIAESNKTVIKEKKEIERHQDSPGLSSVVGSSARDNGPTIITIKRPQTRSVDEYPSKKKPKVPSLSQEPARPKANITIKRDESQVTPLPLSTNKFSPATLQQRVGFLKVIKDNLVAVKEPLPSKRAMDLEFEVLSNSSKLSYPANIRSLIKKIKSKEYLQNNEDRELKTKRSQEQLNAELEKLIIPEKILLLWKFTTSPVNPKELDNHFRTVCCRCGTSFDSADKRPVECRHHLFRISFKFDRVEGHKVGNFDCCSSAAEDSEGCRVADRHVFKLDDPELLAGVIPFTVIPKQINRLFAVALDCEMAYTSFGMELIRLTVVDWESRKTVMDRTVFPYGEVLDLNSRFSGIHDLSEGIRNSDGTVSPTTSFKEARQELFQLISDSTIIIGHGLENDLNALRLIHTRVVDTALRYPSFNPVYRYSLKRLAFRYLGKNIQAGEHDSSEDAIAAMDVVLANIKRVT